MVARAAALRLRQSICQAARRQPSLSQVSTCLQHGRHSSFGCLHVRTCTGAALVRGEDSKPGLRPSDRTLAPSNDQDDAELLEALQSAIELLGEDAKADHPLVEARDRIVSATRDKAALLKRNWTDEMFQDGNDANEERVAEIEAMMVNTLGRVQGGLHDSENLGNALDLVGVYMKNYQLDKANSVLARCGPFVSERSGVWMVKWLNHISTVRMKQGRHMEALEMLYELEMYSPYNSQEAPEFFETLYRNLAWALKALGRIDEAAIYFGRMATMSQTTKGELDWFDCWDIGKLAATRAYQANDMEAFYRGRGLIEQALSMHIKAEPEDLVMRAKVLDSLAECFLVVKEYADAEKHYSAAYDLLQQTVGRQSPLFGKQARHAANLHIAQGQYEQALPFLGEALAVEAAKDAVNVLELMELVDTLVNAQQRSSSEAVERVESNHPSLKQLQTNLKRRGLDSSREYAVLCHKASLLYLHEGRTNPDALRRARRLAKTSVRILRLQAGDKDAADWLKMAELHLRMLDSARRSRGA